MGSILTNYIITNIFHQKKVLLFLGTSESEKIAQLQLRIIRSKNINSKSLKIVEILNGKHGFINPLHQFIINIHYKLNADKDKNVCLDRNHYSQVKVANSVPRKIYLISLGSREILNIFPTDLHDKIDNEHFKISLRSGGKANHQLESIGKCLLAEMQSEAYSEVYGPD